MKNQLNGIALLLLGILLTLAGEQLDVLASPGLVLLRAFSVRWWSTGTAARNRNKRFIMGVCGADKARRGR